MPKIYHFTKLSTAIEYILPSMALRTNFLNNMNGPKENQLWAFGGVNIDYEGIYPSYSHENHIEHQQKLGEEIKSKVQVICFVHSKKHPGFENEMMWAQYSENHRGVCLELDLDIFIQENKNIDFFKFENINYKLNEDVSLHWNRNVSKDKNMEAFINRYFEPLFLSKSHYWKKEYEKRLLILNNNQLMLNIQKSLTGVYYGLSTPFHYDEAIEQFINWQQTKIYKVFFEQNRLKRMQKRTH